MKSISIMLFISLFFLSACNTTDYETLKTELKSEIYDDLESKINSFDSVAFNQHFNHVTDKMQRCTVGLTVIISNQESTGSGVIIDYQDGLYYGITNEHVVRYNESIKAHVFNQENSLEVLIEKTDQVNDLALFSFYSEESVDVCSLNSDNVNVGDFVFAVGSPINNDYVRTVTFGILSNLSGDLLQHDAAINVGSSGGPLFNIEGEVIGVNVSKRSTTSITGSITPVEGMGFAIKAGTISDFINE